jgi:hypothetical protein
MMHGEGIRIASTVYARPIIGFYTTRFVKAESLIAAEEKTKGYLSKEWTSEPYVSSNSGALPTLIVQSVQEVGFFDWLRSKNKGYSFYVDEDARTVA